MEKIDLTAFSKGAGCGCKIAPKVLEEILTAKGRGTFSDARLLAGSEHNEDAAAYQFDDENLWLSSTDFFTPIVNDPFQFGQVAAANALSDIYAMGGQPLFTLAILGWPVERLSPATAGEVMDGARNICHEAGVAIAGGHSVDIADPVFGLTVNGLVKRHNLKRNNTIREGDLLFITKPIGVGILATALKRGVIKAEDQRSLISQLIILNKIGFELGKLEGVTAMTDVTGFGIAGHLVEMCRGTGLSVELNFDRLPVMPGVYDYLRQNIIPDATYRNWNAYSGNLKIEPGVPMMPAFQLLPDPQTNGGLLFSVRPEAEPAIKQLLVNNGLAEFSNPIGKVLPGEESLIHVT
ncbi:MAG TPA: selenide, water dikinase SelD [Edaphocola sp.]|nr:selenide, water dikinase SelD [Edaphocola sp.]